MKSRQCFYVDGVQRRGLSRNISRDCPNCGAPRESWTDGGTLVKGLLYCCGGCATGKGYECGADVPQPEESLDHNG